jgi:hypothetical protein
VKITRNQLKQLIKEELSLFESDADGDGRSDSDELLNIAAGLNNRQDSVFPPLEHPLISQYADEIGYQIKGETDGLGRESWFKEYITYTYAPRPNNIQAKQSIVLYRLLNDKYTARINGAYSNTVSGPVGEFDNPMDAIQTALNSGVTNTGPIAKDLINKVGTKITGSPTGGAWYD